MIVLPGKGHVSSWIALFVLAFMFILVISSCSDRPSSPKDLEPTEPRPGILFTSDRSGDWDIYLVQADGSGLTQITDHPQVDADPDWSPDGSQIAFRSRRDGSSDIFIMGSDGSSPINLFKDPPESLDDEFAPRWNQNGETFSLYTDRFPPRGSCISGFHQIVLLRLRDGKYEFDLFDTNAGEQYSSTWSPDGRYLVFSSACRLPGYQLHIYDTESGETQILTNEPISHTHPAWSHNGQYLAFTKNINKNNEIFLLDLNTQDQIQLTNNPAKDTMPTWSPDDSQIAFVSDRDGNDEIYIMDIDGANLVNLTQHPADDWYPSWSPVGKSP
jgi:Tol biopolymer transport system component